MKNFMYSVVFVLGVIFMYNAESDRYELCEWFDMEYQLIRGACVAADGLLYDVGKLMGIREKNGA